MPRSKNQDKIQWSSLISISSSLAVFIPIATTLIIAVAIAKQTLLHHLLGITVTAQVSQATIITTGLIAAIFVSILALPTFYFLREISGEINKTKRLALVGVVLLVSLLIVTPGPASSIWGRAFTVIIGLGILSITGAGLADIIYTTKTSNKSLADIGIALLKFVGIAIVACFLLTIFITRSVVQQIQTADYHTTFNYENKTYVIITKENNNYLVSELCDKKNIVKYGSFRYIPIEKVTGTELQVFALTPRYCDDSKRELPRYIL